ncbi:hypothetical protein SAMN04487898_10355 [Pedobacter sp. ok626]|uniref:hypothetical protein n=1 Tax=Pedobacter sp. ok626 TaxID=1761882 RepID=UPI0008895891|nr:hypothetical protein [Pedobacter sp. ok626]SDJ48485.1 hypothetical protein SAMN04487898_10355 [Pedobacter sp. ok626]
MKIIGISLISIVLGSICYYFLTFDLLEVKLDELKRVRIADKPYELIIYRVNGDATVQNSIQVRELGAGVEKVLANYERYDSLVSVNYVQRSLQLLLKNPTSRTTVLDTVYLELP